jgi:hypothetical protein
MAKLHQSGGGSEEGGLSPGRACKDESRKHVKGQKRTPFAECVVAAAKLRRHEHQEGES